MSLWLQSSTGGQFFCATWSTCLFPDPRSKYFTDLSKRSWLGNRVQPQNSTLPPLLTESYTEITGVIGSATLEVSVPARSTSIFHQTGHQGTSIPQHPLLDFRLRWWTIRVHAKGDLTFLFGTAGRITRIHLFFGALWFSISVFFFFLEIQYFIEYLRPPSIPPYKIWELRIWLL